MAETSYLWDNPGTGDSPAGGYGNSILCQVIFRMLFNGTGNQGVLRGWLNALEVTNGGGLNAAVNTGGAMCYGVWYENDAATTVALPNNSTVFVVVRASWAAQTSRLAQVAALVQAPGVTYDIPLAEVTTAGGAITLITDNRDYCEFAADLLDDVVETDHIVNDAVTTGKLENQTRWITRGAGEPKADATNPASWNNTGLVLPPFYSFWNFTENALDAIWVTFRVPSDYDSGTATVYLWNNGMNDLGVVWGWDSWDAQASAALANQAGTLTISQVGRDLTLMYRDALCTLNVAAGDIFHLQIYRDGTDLADDCPLDAKLHMVEIAYTADS